MASFLEAFNRITGRIEDFFLTYLVIVMTLAIFVQVIMRYVFNNSLSWTEEFATLCFMWLTWIGASNGVKRNAHIRILVLVDLMKEKYRNWAMVLIDAVWLVFSALLVRYGANMVILSFEKRRISAALEVPMYFMYFSVVLGGFLMCLGLLSSIIARWSRAMGREG